MKTLIFFGKADCPGCKEKFPVVLKVLEKFPDVKLLYMGTDDHPNYKALAAAYGFGKVPAVVLLNRGNTVWRSVGGLISELALEAHLSATHT